MTESESSVVFEVSTTLPTREVAEHLATELVMGNLAACVQIFGPMESVYRWQGNLDQTTEFGLRIKTSEQRLPDTLNALRSQHPYELPEIMWHRWNATKEYANWVNGICSQ